MAYRDKCREKDIDNSRWKDKMFDTKEKAIADFASYAILMTDSTNREHAAVLRKKSGKYYYTRIEKGFHSTVWPTAIKYAVLQEEKYFLHTHPNHGWVDRDGNSKDNNPLSGVPSSRKVSDIGDTTVVDVLGYDGIYLVSAMGNLYLYEGVGIPKPKNNTFANNHSELRALKPILTGLTQSKYCYKQINTKKDRDSDHQKMPWSP